MLVVIGATAAAGVAAAWLVMRGAFEFPPETEPEGAYLRITYNLAEGDPIAVFDYLEDPARDAVFTIHDFRRRSRDLVQAHFPEPERTKLVTEYASIADAVDGHHAFVVMAEERGWMRRLRRDLSGVTSVQIEGERATIVTARETRYSFRKRQSGAWGLTMFTPELLSEANRAARDFDVVRRAAEDYAAVAPK